MKRLKRVGISVFIIFFIAVIAYADSDSTAITVHINVLPGSTVEFSDGIIDPEIIPSNTLVRTPTVEGQTYREVIPLPEE